MKKYYIVPAEIMESNFPDDFENGIYPGQIMSTIETTMTADQIANKLMAGDEDCAQDGLIM